MAPGDQEAWPAKIVGGIEAAREARDAAKAAGQPSYSIWLPTRTSSREKTYYFAGPGLMPKVIERELEVSGACECAQPVRTKRGQAKLGPGV